MFTIYPAIDLRGGRVVRLIQGRAENEIVYGADPSEMARRWEGEGGAWLHVVNLDGAFGDADNLNADALKNILAAVEIPVQFGGGLRDLGAMRRALDLGVARVIVGTVAIETPESVADAVHEFGTEKIVIAVDARDGVVATRGWVEGSGMDAREFGKKMRAFGAGRAIVTDIARDGMLSGIDAAAMADFARATDLQVIASGGVASLEDVRSLLRVEAIGVEGVIVGQALYQGAFSLRGAIQVAQDKMESRKNRICEG